MARGDFAADVDREIQSGWILFPLPQVTFC
jgi:hypothetical protein